MIFSIAMGADCSFYVKSIATYAPAFFGYNSSVLARVFLFDFDILVFLYFKELLIHLWTLLTIEFHLNIPFLSQKYDLEGVR